MTGLSTKIIIQFAVVMIASLGLLVYFSDTLRPFYFENQMTDTGIVINSAIIVLLLVGLANILFHLLRYRREEVAITTLVKNVESRRNDLMEGIPVDSIVARRHTTMRMIEKADGEINHGALAAMLNADEATHFGLIRFINNILILTGVFGTIVALSIALLGASDLIDSADASLSGMGLVIHGMSTALSTTITAIVSYGLFGYFYTRLNDVQTHFLSGIEHLTSVHLLPQYVKSTDDIVRKMSDLVKSVVVAADNLKMTQEVYHDAALNLHDNIASQQARIEALGNELNGIKHILRQGFRLPETERES